MGVGKSKVKVHVPGSSARVMREDGLCTPLRRFAPVTFLYAVDTSGRYLRSHWYLVNDTMICNRKNYKSFFGALPSTSPDPYFLTASLPATLSFSKYLTSSAFICFAT